MNITLITLSFICILSLTIMGCSTSSSYSQKSIDTKECNDISYGNNNVDVNTLDTIYNNCMENMKKSRAKKRKEARNLGFIDFLFTLFTSAEN